MSSPEQSFTPKRRRLVDQVDVASPAPPASPAARALSGLRSWLSPWRGKASRSAAFGAPSPEHSDQQFRPQRLFAGDDRLKDSDRDLASSSSAQPERQDDGPDAPLYPSLPSASFHPPSIQQSGQGSAADARSTFGQVSTPSGNLFPGPSTSALQSSSDAAAAAAQGSSSYPFTFAPPAHTDAYRSGLAFASASGRSTPVPSQQPDDSAHLRAQSPLSRNYSLLARFFAQKAAEEHSDADAPGFPSGRHGLTDEELSGCWRLIEESGRSPADVQRALGLHRGSSHEGSPDPAMRSSQRRRVRRSWLAPPEDDDDDYDAADRHSVGQSSLGRRSFVAPQSSVPRSGLSASATDPNLFARSVLGRPAPQASSSTHNHNNNNNNNNNKNNNNVFLSGGSTAPGLRSRAVPSRRRPIYLGPGMSARRTPLSSTLGRSVPPPAPAQAPGSSSLATTNTVGGGGVGLGKRSRLDDGGSRNSNREDEAAPPEMTLQELEPRPIAPIGRLPSSQSTPSLSFSRNNASGNETPRRREPSSTSTEDRDRSTDKPAPRTRTANAMLSILSQPDLQKPAPSSSRTKLNASSASSGASTHTPGQSPVRTDAILNPYQAAPGLNLGASTSSSASASSSSNGSTKRTLQAVEKMKEERRRSTRLRKSGSGVASDDGPGLLEKLEQTRPGGSSGSGKRRNVGSAGSEEPSTVQQSESPSTPPRPSHNSAPQLSTTPTNSPPPLTSASKTAEEKTAEAKRRLSAMQSTPQQQQQRSSSSSSSSTTTTTSLAPSTPSNLAFARSHLPGRPSRLSIAFNANESPSSSSTADDDELNGRRDTDDDDDVDDAPPAQTLSTSSPFSFTTPDKAKTSGTPKASGFSFAPAALAPQPASKPEAAAPAAPAPMFSFAPAASAPSKPTSTAAAAGTSSPFSFSAPKSDPEPTLAAPKPSTPFAFAPAPSANASQPAAQPAAPSATASSSTSKSPREEALAKSATALPTYNLSVSVVPSFTWAASGSELKKAGEKTVDELPVFDLSSGAKDDAPAKSVSSSTSMTAPAPSNPFSFSAPTTAPATSGLSLSPSPTHAAPPAASTKQPTESSTGGDGDAAPAEDAASSSTSTSALLGSGEGEEHEVTLHETRAKFWKFSSGKWEDLGVGLARVKKADSPSADGKTPRRLLVRNVGNGAVNVNFRLFPDFKATQTANALAFTGFDQKGKGVPMRCKVKTADGASELKEVLEREAKEA